jgi:hypothetical protein
MSELTLSDIQKMVFILMRTTRYPVEKMLTNQWFAFVNSDYLLQFCGHYNQIQNLTSQNGLIQFFHTGNCY